MPCLPHISPYGHREEAFDRPLASFLEKKDGWRTLAARTEFSRLRVTAHLGRRSGRSADG